MDIVKKINRLSIIRDIFMAFSIPIIIVNILLFIDLFFNKKYELFNIFINISYILVAFYLIISAANLISINHYGMSENKSYMKIYKFLLDFFSIFTFFSVNYILRLRDADIMFVLFSIFIFSISNFLIKKLTKDTENIILTNSLLKDNVLDLKIKETTNPFLKIIQNIFSIRANNFSATTSEELKRGLESSSLTEIFNIQLEEIEKTSINGEHSIPINKKFTLLFLHDKLIYPSKINGFYAGIPLLIKKDEEK